MTLSFLPRGMLTRSLLLNVLLYHLYEAGTGFTNVTATGGTWAVPRNIPSNSTADSRCPSHVKVWINSSGSKVNEGDDVTLTCIHNLTGVNLVFGWKQDGKEINKEEARNKSQLCLKNTRSHDAGEYVCFVNNAHVCCESSPEKVSVKNQAVVLLIICGVTALVMVLCIGLAMKYKLKRDGAKSRERRQQRELQQNSAPSFIHA